MSASHTPVRVRWALPLFGLALALAVLLGLIAIPNAGAAPPPLLDNAWPATLAARSCTHLANPRPTTCLRTRRSYHPRRSLLSTAQQELRRRAARG